jgi:hypothetical protein
MMGEQVSIPVGLWNDESIAWAEQDTFAGDSVSDISLSPLDTNHFVLACKADGAGRVIRGRIPLNNPTNIIWDYPQRFEAFTGLTVAGLDNDLLGLFWRTSDETPVTRMAWCGDEIGIAAEAASAGESCNVILSGVSDVHSNLTQGVLYYDNRQFELGALERQSLAIGLGLATNKLLLNPELRRIRWE